MKELKIEIPENCEIDQERPTFERIVFKEKIKDICKRIQTMKDVFELNNTTEEEFNEKWKGFSNFEVGIAKEVLIAAAYNQGKLPDWEDGNAKYYPYFNMDKFSFYYCSYWHSYSYVSARLCFLNKNHLLDAVKKFLPEFKQSRLG